MTEYKPGDRVKHARYGEGVIVGPVEGWWHVEWDPFGSADIRPSELTPADPVPDAAVMLATRIWEEGHALIAGKAQDASWVAQEAHIATMARYIRANPPQPLTVERVREAVRKVWGYNAPQFQINKLQRALTEPNQ